jgi:hypothetical protein
VLVRQSQLARLIAAQVVEYDIGGLHQVTKNLHAFGLSQVERDAAFVPIPGLKIKAVSLDAMWRYTSRDFSTSARVFNLDHLGAHVRQIQRGKWAGAELRKGQYPKTLQW